MPTPPASTRRVVLADDDEGVRTAVAALLALEPDLAVVAQARDADEAVAAASGYGATLVVVDVRMPGGGAALVRRLVTLPSRPVVVGLSANADASTWTELLRSGATGYLLKGSLGDDLASLLRRCVDGQLVVTVPGAAATLRRLLAP